MSGGGVNTQVAGAAGSNGGAGSAGLGPTTSGAGLGPTTSGAGNGGDAGAIGGAGASNLGGEAGATAPSGGGSGGVASAGTGPVVVSPAADGYAKVSSYPAPQEAKRSASAPPATLDTFVHTSNVVFGKLQNGPTSRNVHVFIPSQYVPGTEVPFMVIHDGDEQIAAFHTDIVLENLIAQKRLPIMAALFVNRPTTTSTTQRSLEYDCLDADYSNFVRDEILPAVQVRHPELKLTSDPNGRGVMGKSSGAVAAFTMAWLHPEQYRRILTFNGSFRNQCADGPGAQGYPDAILATPAQPLRMYLFSGSGDIPGYAAANQAMADALDMQKYPWRYVYGEGATHSNMYAASLVTEALLWVWAGYPL